MQDTPDELSSNADTVSRDHDIAINIQVVVLVSTSKIICHKNIDHQKAKVISLIQKKNNMQFAAQSISKIQDPLRKITLSEYTIKTVKMLRFFLPVHLPHIWTA